MTQRSGLLLIFFIGAGIANFSWAESNRDVLEKVWKVGQTSACTAKIRNRFDQDNFLKLRAKLNEGENRGDLAAVLNPFLFSLGVSHTQFFTDRDESYYLFKGYWSETHADVPEMQIVNPGVQIGSDKDGYFAREVLDGSAAQEYGLAKGDRILSVDGVKFEGHWGREPKLNVNLALLRKGVAKEMTLNLPALNWSQAFQSATLNSIHVLSYLGHSVGYVHLWSGVHPESAQALWRAVREFKDAKVEAVILDLRGGYGGAFWDHLDPFFVNREDYFTFNVTDIDALTTDMKADARQNVGAYEGPMAVIIDQGSRSGKEALAYQFVKSKRATLVGQKTAGYFSGGGLFFVDQPVDYLLYLCVNQATLDGQQIEGVGVVPNVAVPFDDENEWQDSQLAAAFEALFKK